MQTTITKTIPTIGATSGAATAHYDSKQGRPEQRYEARDRAHNQSLRGEVIKTRSDGIAAIRLPDKELLMRLPATFSIGDVLYGLYSQDGAWTIYAAPSSVIIKNTPASILELFGLPKNYLYRASLLALAEYMPVVSKADAATFAAASELIATDFHISESDAVELVKDLHSHGSPLNARHIRKSAPSIITQKDFYRLAVELADNLKGDFLHFKPRLELMMAAAADPSRDIRKKINLFQIGKPDGNDETIFGFLTDLIRAHPPETIAIQAKALAAALEGRYFMNLCALAAGLPLRLWIASSNNEIAELTILREQIGDKTRHTASLTVETDSLGITGIHLASFEREITAQFFAENDSARDLLADSANEFARALGSIGFNRKSVAVTKGKPQSAPKHTRSDIRISI